MKKFANDAAHKTNGHEHRDDGQRGSQHRQPDFLCAVHRRVIGVLSHLHVPNNVLTHHNGIVDQQTHAQTQRHHGDHVDGEPQHVHEQESADQGNRQGQAGDDGRAPRVEKQKDDQHGECGALNQGAAYIFHRHPDLA